MDWRLRQYTQKVSRIRLSGQDIAKGLRFPEYISEDLAYLCGVLAGDGNIHVREKKHDHTIKCVGNPKDEQEFYQTVLVPLFQKVFNIYLKVGHKNKGTTFGFAVHSKALCNYLTDVIQLPKGKKYPSLNIPLVFLNSDALTVAFIRGLFDTDGCICFKKRSKPHPYYPVISLSSNCKGLVKQTSRILKNLGLKIAETYDYNLRDKRIKKGYTTINRIEISGKKNFNLWMKLISFSNPKHLEKIKKVAREGFEPSTFTQVHDFRS